MVFFQEDPDANGCGWHVGTRKIPGMDEGNVFACQGFHGGEIRLQHPQVWRRLVPQSRRLNRLFSAGPARLYPPTVSGIGRPPGQRFVVLAGKDFRRRK